MTDIATTPVIDEAAKAARRRFALWALGMIVVMLPLWWLWGAPLAATALRLPSTAVLWVLGLPGPVTADGQGGWLIGTGMRMSGQTFAFPMDDHTLRRLLLGVPLTLALLLAPPRPPRLWRALGIAAAVLAVLFPVTVALTAWGEIAALLDPGRATVDLAGGARPDGQPLPGIVAQIVIVGRYVSIAVAPLLVAGLLWAGLNAPGFRLLSGRSTAPVDADPAEAA